MNRFSNLADKPKMDAQPYVLCASGGISSSGADAPPSFSQRSAHPQTYSARNGRPHRGQTFLSIVVVGDAFSEDWLTGGLISAIKIPSLGGLEAGAPYV